MAGLQNEIARQPTKRFSFWNCPKVRVANPSINPAILQS